MSRKILWLPSWFPSRVDLLTGDFIERHAKAASIYEHITILFAVKDKSLKGGQTSRESRKYNDNLNAEILYYGAGSHFQSVVQYFTCYYTLFKEYLGVNGKPYLIHVHVVFRAGIMALFLKYRFGIEYVISEHWSVFSDKATPTFSEKSFLTRWLIKRIYTNALKCTAVSNHLAELISDKTGIKKPGIIPNVFDQSLFFPGIKTDDTFKFIHISQLNDIKNPDQIIKAVQILKQKTDKPFKLIIYGPEKNGLIKQMSDLIEFRKEIPQSQLSQEIRKCHCLILYSSFETFGCVVIEAQASGLPVIVSDIPAMHETVEENVSGIFVQPDHPVELANKMLWMMDNYQLFNSSLISENTGIKYSFAVVGKLFSQLYTH